MQTFDVWMVIDDCGGYGVGVNREDAMEHYENNIQAIADAGQVRYVKVPVQARLPRVVELAAVTVPDED